LLSGRYSIVIEGCDGSGFSRSCRQGWSAPVFVDVGAIDIIHKDSGGLIPIRASQSPADAAAALEDRVTTVFRLACGADLSGEADAAFASKALGKLYMSDVVGVSDCSSPTTLIDQVNKALLGVKPKGHVGTTVAVGEGAGIGAAEGALVGTAVVPGVGTTIAGAPPAPVRTAPRQTRAAQHQESEGVLRERPQRT